MAKKKFTELPAVTTPLTGDEIIAMVQGGVSKRGTVNDLPSGGGGGSGTVTSVGALSPLFTTANATTTPTFTLINQNANKVFAGPTNGADAAPTFRVLVAADIPDLSAAYLPIGGGTLTGPLILSADPLTALGAATKQYVDAAVVGLWDDRGNFDASGGAYPSSGGSGTAGAILKGDIWTISVAGTLPTGQVVEPGDTIRALVDTPGNTQANWAIAQNNIGYTPLTSTLASANIFVGNGSNVATGVAMSGEATIANTGAVTITNSAVIGKVLTGYTSGAGTVAATDTILEAIQKLNGNDATKWSLASGGALTANNTISGAFTLLFNLTGGNNQFEVTGSFTAASAAVQAIHFSPTVTGRGTSNDSIAIARFDGTCTNSTGSAVNQSGLIITPTFSGSVVSGPLQQSLLVLAGSSTSGTRIARFANSSSASRFVFTADGLFNWTTIATGTTWDGNITGMTNGNGVITVSHTLGLPSASGGTAFHTKYTSPATTNNTNTVLNLIWYNPTYTANHTGMTASGILYDPVIAGTETSTLTHYAFRAASGFSGFGTTSPTALLHVGAGSATVAPMKMTSGTILTSAAAAVKEYDGTHYETKGSGLRYANGGCIFDVVSDIQNSGTSETDLHSYTTPASTLAATGEKIIATYAGTFNDATATAQIKVYFAGTVIFDSTALTVLATGSWAVSIIIIRTGASTARALVSFSTLTATVVGSPLETDLTGITFTNTNIFKITGTASGGGGGSSDITLKMGTGFWNGLAAN